MITKMTIQVYNHGIIAIKFCFSICLFLLVLFNSFISYSQENKTRILFILDGSGSMGGKWENESKFELAKELLFNTIDSLENSSQNIEFGLRIFGHQTPKEFKDCEDSRLEIEFSRDNSTNIFELLTNIKNQGQTPIAYSLFEGTNDFPANASVKNIIILITDGIETCEGDPCAITGILHQKKIVFKPFIIGLGMGEEGKDYFDCVGTFYDANDKESFVTILDVVVSQALNNTTTQFNLLDVYGEPTETNTEISIYDEFSGKLRYNFVHSLDRYGIPDTVFINPVEKYDITIHTTPPVRKEGVRINPGKHNIIAINAGQGQLFLNLESNIGFSDATCIIRKSGSDEILNVQHLDTRQKLLVGIYDLEVLTLPRLNFSRVKIDQGKETMILIEASGKLSISSSRPGIASIYRTNDGEIEMVYEIDHLANRYDLRLQPGEYQLVYRPFQFNSSELTQVKNFTIYSRSTANVKL